MFEKLIQNHKKKIMKNREKLKQNYEKLKQNLRKTQKLSTLVELILQKNSVQKSSRF